MFRRLTAQVAASLGMPELRIVEVDHPLGGTDPAVVAAWADEAAASALALLTDG